MKNIFEVLDEFELATNKKERMLVIEKNLSKTLVQVFELAYHPQIEWLMHEMPDNYKIPTDTLPGISTAQLSNQGKKKRMMTAPPITNTPQNLASIESISTDKITAEPKTLPLMALESWVRTAPK